MRLSNIFNGIGLVALLALVVYTCTNETIVEPIKATTTTTTTSKSDSLQNVIDSLQIELDHQAEGFDSKEKRYEDVLFEYEFGVDYLEKYHPEAYRDFHRIIGFKERFKRSDEKENKKRLHIEKD
jgi:hypothetical protein